MTATGWLPTEITPADCALTDTERIGELLVAHKALVLRGFGVAEAGLTEAMDALLPNRLAYVHGNSPRTKVGDNVYTSTEYPADQTISMHNELSYALHWPARLLFYCAREPATGGATPVVDGQVWLDALDAQVREAFAGGLRYTQNLHGGSGFGKSWQDTFETGDRAVVDAFLAGNQAVWVWKPDGGLRVDLLRPATTKHPVTGAEVWFNQADQWHPAALDEETAEALGELFAPEDMPQTVCFADGSPIPADYVRQIRDRGLAAAVDVDWRLGDLLLIDNVSVGHGRRPFTGPRRILVGMSG